MMVTFREKWLTTLLLAILLHIVIFSILYININKKTIDNSNKKNSNNIVTPVILEKNYPPLKTQTDTVMPTNVVENTVPDVRSPNEVPSSQQASQPEMIESETAYYKETRKLTASDNKMLKVTNDKVIESNKIIKIAPNVSENTESSMAINNAGLLDMDTPAQNTFGKTNKEYDAAKSDLDQTNNQLSNAIDEVKKRNQQKIDELHQQSPYPAESDNIFN